LPLHKTGSIKAPLLNKVVAALATHFDTTIASIWQHVQVNSIEQWWKVQYLEGGDTMDVALVVKAWSDMRNTTFV
jgi:hypothetical protein